MIPCIVRDRVKSKPRTVEVVVSYLVLKLLERSRWKRIAVKS